MLAGIARDHRNTTKAPARLANEKVKGGRVMGCLWLAAVADLSWLLARKSRRGSDQQGDLSIKKQFHPGTELEQAHVQEWRSSPGYLWGSTIVAVCAPIAFALVLYLKPPKPEDQSTLLALFGSLSCLCIGTAWSFHRTMIRTTLSGVYMRRSFLPSISLSWQDIAQLSYTATPPSFLLVMHDGKRIRITNELPEIETFIVECSRYLGAERISEEAIEALNVRR